jgi:hypothetical protein
LPGAEADLRDSFAGGFEVSHEAILVDSGNCRSAVHSQVGDGCLEWPVEDDGDGFLLISKMRSSSHTATLTLRAVAGVGGLDSLWLVGRRI